MPHGRLSGSCPGPGPPNLGSIAQTKISLRKGHLLDVAALNVKSAADLPDVDLKLLRSLGYVR